jgi:aminopeptidase 2
MPAISEEIYVPDAAKETAQSPDLAKLFSSLTTQYDEWKITRFQTTPLMSSYIVAFANGHFEYLEKTVHLPLSGKTLPLRIYGEILSLLVWTALISGSSATSDIIHQAQFALDVKAQVLPLYEQVFDVAYPLPKLDTLVVGRSVLLLNLS